MTREPPPDEHLKLKVSAELRETLSKLKALLARVIQSEDAPSPDVGDPRNLLLMAATRDIQYVGTLEAALRSLPEGSFRDTFRDAMLVILQDRILHYRRFTHRVCGELTQEQRQRWPHLFPKEVDP